MDKNNMKKNIMVSMGLLKAAEDRAQEVFNTATDMMKENKSAEKLRSMSTPEIFCMCLKEVNEEKGGDKITLFEAISCAKMISLLKENGLFSIGEEDEEDEECEAHCR